MVKNYLVAHGLNNHNNLSIDYFEFETIGNVFINSL